MSSTVLVSDKNAPTTIYGVYGGSGTLLWKRMGTGAFMMADWDSFEWVSLAPGDNCGEHLHSQTEEVFYVLDGQGKIIIDGYEYPFGAGDVALTPLGARHDVINTGDVPLDYLVIEMFPPEIMAATPSRTPDPQ